MTKQEVIQAFKLDPKKIRETLLSYYKSVNFYKQQPYQSVTPQQDVIAVAQEIFSGPWYNYIVSIEHFIRGKHDSGNHDGLYSNRKRLEEAIAEKEVFEQLQVCIAVYKQRAGLPQEIVDYHTRILKEWGILDKNGKLT